MYNVNFARQISHEFACQGQRSRLPGTKKGKSVSFYRESSSSAAPSSASSMPVRMSSSKVKGQDHREQKNEKVLHFVRESSSSWALSFGISTSVGKSAHAV